MSSSSSSTLVSDFERSYNDYARYPCNLIDQCNYSRSLDDQKARFDVDARSMVEDSTHDGDFNKVFVIFRDSKSSLDGFHKLNIQSDGVLKQCLEEGIPSCEAGLAPKNLPVSQFSDPKCRFIYLQSGHSRAKLQVTREMLTRILTFHQVMPSYLDFISVFGLRVESKNKRFSGRALRFTGFQHVNASCLKISSLSTHGRSGRIFGLCYNLKRVSDVSNDCGPSPSRGQPQWSVQQAAFHHQFDVETGNALWITTVGDYQDIKKKIADLTGSTSLPADRSYGNVVECLRSALAVHLVYAHWSTSGWRWYVEYLEDKIEEISQKALVEEAKHVFTPKDLQSIQQATDKTNEAIMVMRGNLDIMVHLQQFYDHLARTKLFLDHACGTLGSTSYDANKAMLDEHVRTFVMQLNGLESEMHMHISRARLLVEIAGDRNRMILQHLQAQATDKMQTMTSLSIKEAIVMRVITVVTLIFLPATFVSTFFSTDIVKYQNTDENGSFSNLAMKRWLEVTLSLTFLTLAIGYGVYRSAKKSSQAQLLPIYNEKGP